MFFLRCEHCGHLNGIKGENLIFCESCNKKISNNFIDWQQRFPLKTFADFENEVCESYENERTSSTQSINHKPHSFGILIAVIVLMMVGGYLVTWFVTKNSDKIIGFSPTQIQFLSSDTTKWIPFTCSEGNYSVYFPGTPLSSRTTSTTDIGDIEIISHFVERDPLFDDNYVYGVGYSVYPQNFIEGTGAINYNVDMIFEGAVTGSVENAGAKLISSFYMPFGDFQGREVQAELNGGEQLLVMRFYLVRNVMYCIQVITPADNFPNKAIDFFFGSFTLINN